MSAEFNVDGVRRILSGLMGREVVVREVPVSTITGWTIVASYIAADGNPQGVCILDINAATNLGGALSLMAPPMVASATQNKALPTNMIENLQEVLNVMSRLFQSATNERATFQQMYISPAVAPAPIQAIIKKPKRRMELIVGAANYTPGRMSLLMPI